MQLKGETEFASAIHACPESPDRCTIPLLTTGARCLRSTRSTHFCRSVNFTLPISIQTPNDNVRLIAAGQVISSQQEENDSFLLNRTFLPVMGMSKREPEGFFNPARTY